MTKVILHDQLTALLLPFLSDDETLFFPAYNGGDVWHTLHMGAELRLSTYDGEPEAEIYYVVGRTPRFKRIQVEDKRTKPEPEPESVEQTIERLMDTIEQLSSHAQFIINMMDNRDCVDSLQRDLNAIINKHQRSY